MGIEHREDELGIVVWLDPEALDRPQKRLLETITARNSRLPLAMPLNTLQLSLTSATLATKDTQVDALLQSTKENPLIFPLPLARSMLGWTEFDTDGAQGVPND